MTPNQKLRQLFSRTFGEAVIAELLKSGRYHLPGFGVWTLRTRPRRRIRNPVTKALMWLPATREVRFHAAKRLKKAAQGTQQPRQRKSDIERGSAHG